MRFSSILLTGAICATASAGIASEVSSKMERMLAMKLEDRRIGRANGWFGDVREYPPVRTVQRCVGGKAGEGPNGTYHCNNVDLHGFLSHGDMGSESKEGNDVWGWTAPDGREFATVGQTDGTAFVEVLPDGQLEYIGRLPSMANYATLWRDIKVIKGYAYIGSEHVGAGMQVFDLRKLLIPHRKTTFWHHTMTAWYGEFGQSHNLVANEETDMIYAVGSYSDGKRCNGGMWMVNVTNPALPMFAGCVSEDGYVHDAQCVIYKGPHQKYTGREICFNYNTDSLTIVDVTDKSNPIQLSKTKYEGHRYTHQGWLIDDEMDYLLMDDELDESGLDTSDFDKRTKTYMWDISNLEKPKNTGVYRSPAQSIDHNQYVVNGMAYQSNYASGLRIVDVSSKDPTTRKFTEAGFFDCHPEDDDDGVTRFLGTWSVYPFFKSGHIILNSIERGLFSLKYNPDYAA